MMLLLVVAVVALFVTPSRAEMCGPYKSVEVGDKYKYTYTFEDDTRGYSNATIVTYHYLAFVAGGDGPVYALNCAWFTLQLEDGSLYETPRRGFNYDYAIYRRIGSLQGQEIRQIEAWTGQRIDALQITSNTHQHEKYGGDTGTYRDPIIFPEGANVVGLFGTGGGSGLTSIGWIYYLPC